MRIALSWFVLLGCVAAPTLAWEQVKNNEPAFASKLVDGNTEGHSVPIEVELADAKQLFLVVTDGGNGFAADWADWAEPRLVGPDGEKKLTELKWKSAKSGWGNVVVNRNCEGAAMRIAGKPVEYGIGTHANSIIAYDLPEGYTHFKARGGLDNGGTDQGMNSSVRFMVYLKEPPKAILAPTTVAEQSGHEPEDAVAGLDVAEGLEATLFAAEPGITSVTNLDIDARGRVWVCEVVNYRGNNGRRPEGDRILILEDTDGDGKSDKETVFYQGRDIDSAMGICVLGNRVIVSASPNIFVFTDEDGDDHADKKDVLFSQTGQPQHDHSAHSFLFGPDGKLYWNFGNTGGKVCDPDGKVIVDKAGNEIVDNGSPYFGGMVFRCNLDGSEMETLGHNFRNNYEVTVDSFGTLWQSDNDDDGNRGVRVNYVMEFGNYGYREEFTGAGWQSPRTGMEEEIPLRHWHLNDPGVVPNLLQTGAGSPTGITMYEGDLLPEIMRGQMLHCDAGPNIVRAYPVERKRAGYQAEMANLLEGARDKWFRPADVCVAPDGSVFVTDWYDPGVGGHGQADLGRGRVFRIAPPNHSYQAPKFDFSTPAGAVDALRNPNYAVRYLAWSALRDMGAGAEAELVKLYESDAAPQQRARALWLLTKLDGSGQKHLEAGLKDKEPDLRIVAVRAARQMEVDVVPIVESLIADPSPQVLRECAIALRHNKHERMPQLWASLADRLTGDDRWYVEALGISADGRWDECFAAWLSKVGDSWDSQPGRLIVWRSRAEAAIPLLGKLILNARTGNLERLRYFRALDFHRPESEEGQRLKVDVLASLVFGNHPDQSAIRLEAMRRFGGLDLSSPEMRAAADEALKTAKDPSEFVELVKLFNLQDQSEQILAIAQKHADEESGVNAINLLLTKGAVQPIEQALASDNAELAASTARVLGKSTEAQAGKLLMPVLRDADASLALRREAARALAQQREGAVELIKLAQSGELDESIRVAAALPLSTAPWNDVRGEAAKLFPVPAGRDNENLPPLPQLLEMRGDAAAGLEVFNGVGTCNKCHQVNGQGKEVGPKLSEIGSKLSRSALFESILFPSAAVSHNFETHAALLDSGNVVTGILISETAEEVVIRPEDGIDRTLKKSEVEEMRTQPVSLMPADLQKTMSAQQLVDVVEYLTTLRQAQQ